MKIVAGLKHGFENIYQLAATDPVVLGLLGQSLLFQMENVPVFAVRLPRMYFQDS